MGWARKRDMDLKPWAIFPCFMSQRGDSGQKKIPMARMKEGIKAEPNWSLQAILPVSLTITLAQKPRKIPMGTISACIGDEGRRLLTDDNPELPKHDKSTPDSVWSHLR